MAFNFFRFLRPKSGTPAYREITCKELSEAAEEIRIRELCFWICVDMIANAIGRCEFRTFVDGKETKGKEYYLWNIEPNTNQNSTAFLHKLIAKLCSENEALILTVGSRAGMEMLAVADTWERPMEYPVKKQEYRGVTVGEVSYSKTFAENEVMHLRMNDRNIKPVIDGMYAAYWRMAEAAMKDYAWRKGKHWKVHVGQVQEGEEGWQENFQAMISKMVKPFFESSSAVLPEFDGYKYEDMSGDSGQGDTRDIKAMVEDIFDFTARAMLIPAVLVNGKIEGTEDANKRFLTSCIDPICDQLQEEITRKRYGYEQWERGTYIKVDSSSILHFDMFAEAPNVEKLVGSGAYTINDLRRAANQPEIQEPWADQHYMTKNIAAMSEITRKVDGG